MKCKMAIVILNYMNYQETQACINCALNQRGEGYEIIVVDNGSDNNAYDILKESFKDITHISFLKLEKNAGFAMGNNYGINYARKYFKAEYIFVCNSDVTFTEDLFESALTLQTKGVGAISPPVYDSNGKPQPISVSTNHIYVKIISTIIQLLYIWCIYIPGIDRLYKIFRRRRKVIPAAKENYINIDWNDKKYNLQGCAFFLTPEFFKYYEQLYPKTFLYWEEINLMVYLSKVHLKAAIIDLPQVIHKGKQSSQSIMKDKSFEKKRLEYSMKSMLKSLPMYFRSYVFILAKYN